MPLIEGNKEKKREKVGVRDEASSRKKKKAPWCRGLRGKVQKRERDAHLLWLAQFGIQTQ
jgi:hypothetical protein